MSIFDGSKTRFISHRGFTPLAPENSLPSFYYAGLLGQWAIETDVRLTRDGCLVCCHNETVEKYCGVDAAISEMTYEELRQLEIVNGHRVGCFPREERRIPLFSEYLSICRRFGSIPCVELKTDDAERVAGAIRASGFSEDEIVMSSVELSRLADYRRYAEKTFIHWIFADEERLGELSDYGNAGLSLKIADPFLCEEKTIARVHAMGLRICLRAADDTTSLLRMRTLGLDYIPTNKMHEMPEGGIL
ncbi:MAG: hypothetical protein IKC26_10940 [Clostridia bacterium]|nr:hypothetical protein [Clostridia bacterium]MBR2908541.1 hypothetical protein [Clostridia bacterium]